MNLIFLGFNDLPRMSHRPNLGYTEAALHESMRLGSVAPTGVPHYTMCDSSIGKYHSAYAFTPLETP